MDDLTPQKWEELFKLVDFTDEERKVIKYRRRGWKWATIAAELYMSERQIYRVRNGIMKKIERVSWQ